MSHRRRLVLQVLTATIVLFNSTHADLLEMADLCIQASAIGFGFALGLMAIARPVERCLLHNRVA